MKTFWIRAILKYFLFLAIAIGAIVWAASLNGTLVWEAVAVAVGVISIILLVRTAIGTGLEYWAMKHMAKKFEVDLELFAQVRYEKKLTLQLISWNQDYFRSELQKKKEKNETIISQS